MERSFSLSILFLAVTVLFGAMTLGTAWGSGGQIVLEADRVEYDQAGGFAVATGNVRMSRDILRVFAPRIEYSANEQTIEAFSTPGERVILLQGAQRLDGDRLSLDIISGEGILTNAKGSFPAEKGEIFASGSDVTTMRIKTARDGGSAPGAIPKGAVEGDQVYRWNDVGFTTCPEPAPHYQLVSRRLVIIPGFRITASRPRIYVGGKFLFSYPFDYSMDLSGGKRSQFLPQVIYEEDKGIGISYGAPFMIGDLNARWKAFLWSEVDFEGALSFDYRLSENVSFFAETRYSWDPDKEEKQFRSQWGADYDLGGWTGRVWWSQAESVTVEKDLGDTFKGTLWRSPEISLYSPWWRMPGSFGSLQLRAIWGDYESVSDTETDIVKTDRFGIGAALSGSASFGELRPFWGIDFWRYDYGTGNGTQEILKTRIGVSWPLGPLTMTSTWARRWVDGGSPMSWDNYSESEAFYQKVVIPFGDSWSLAVRGGYNLKESKLDEMYYRISFMGGDCYRVDLAYRDDLAGDDDWAGITFVLNAFPSHPFFLGANEITEFDE